MKLKSLAFIALSLVLVGPLSIHAGERPNGHGCFSYTTKMGECRKDVHKNLYCDFTNANYYKNCADGPAMDLREGECKDEGFRCWTYEDASFQAGSQCDRNWSATANAWLPSCRNMAENDPLLASKTLFH